MTAYLRPAELEAALAALAARPHTIIAGGTDLYPAHAGRPLPGPLLDLTAIPELGGITESDDHWRLGAMTTWSELARVELPPCFDGLKQAAREIGGPQIQNVGTLGGNLCNASPAADGVPPLLTLEARVELASAAATTTLALEDFALGNRRTALAADQIVSAIIVPKPPQPAAARFAKLGARRYMVISVASVAVLLLLEGGSVASARLAVGACSEAPLRLPEAEAALAGAPCASGLGERLEAGHLAALAPIDDVRATAAYRRDGALVLLRRTLESCANGARV
ncbi:MAG TPA: FAD binding domain-containing protein [Alphaproteobacteria bacterium]|jgi:CO/xanthine dehydrogenase FAD-binding subunit|nr:FAD binding domain-containing protein [Alphaproteobacteria bacterium]HJP23152.1 FAD binding domain-containing protein [Alphaproteobacteria bacterium]